MKHFGDITKLSGYDLPPVDCITGGSPCQDLSIAGKREGLAGERSGLFMEQIRIVKEMRERDRNNGRSGKFVRPRYMVWENVPGAFSSNGGKDFQAVLEEIVGIAEETVPDLRTAVTGGWTKAGCLYDELGTWSIAWRLHDAQFWGVPQRRKRIALVADFGGLSAPEILFERKGVSWNPEPGETAGKEAAGSPGGGSDSAISFQERGGKPGGGKGILIQKGHIGALSTLNNQAVLCLNDQGGSVMNVNHDMSGSLRAEEHGHQPVIVRDAEPILLESNQNHATVQTDGISTALPASMGMGGGYVPMITYGFNRERCGAVAMVEKMPTLQAAAGESGNNKPMVVSKTAYAEESVYCIQGNCIDRSDTAGCNGRGWTEDVSYTLNTIDRPAVCAGFKGRAGAASGSIGYEEEVAPTLNAEQQAHVYDARGNGSGDIVPTITGDHNAHISDYTAICIGNGQSHMASHITEELSQTLNCMHDPMAVLCFQNTGQGWWNESNIGATLRTPCGGDSTKANLVAAVDCRNGTEDDGVNGTLQSHQSGGTSLNLNNTVRIRNVVRRLTPMECERLQGYPDRWTDIGSWYDTKGKYHKESSDSSRYKALGNSIALPFWFWLLRRISAQYERPATLGSLFDGIGGFPLCWERCNGTGTALWASEIEEFPIAVTKYHFPESRIG